MTHDRGKLVSSPCRFLDLDAAHDVDGDVQAIMASVNGHFSSAGDMKSHLQSLLDSKEQQLQQAATFGQRVLAQRMELEDRIRQLQEVEADKTDDEDVEPEAVQKYQELTDMMMSWDTENALLSSAFNSSMECSSITVSDLPRDEPERSRTSTNTSAAQSRRAKNAAHRADDVEFAFEIGSGLLNEVRRLQSLLGERDKAIQDMKEEKDDLDGTLESLRTALKQQEASADKYKEENWNLEVSLQDLRTQHADTQSTVQRLDSEQKRLTKLLAASHDASEQYKNENAQLQSTIEDLTAKHETDVALARKHAAALARDKSDLQQAIDRLKAEKERAGRKFGRFGSPATPNTTEGRPDEDYLTPAGYGDDVFSSAASTNRRNRADTSLLFGDEMDGDLSPDQSPMSRSPFLAANHPVNEIEVLKQRLAHAHRQIATLKGGLMRERMGKGRGTPVEDEDEEDGFEDVDDEDEENIKLRSSSTRLRGRGRGRGRGRVRGRGPTLTERLMAADSPSSVSEYYDDASPTRRASVPPIHFQGADEDDMEDVTGEPDDDEDIFKANIEPSAESPSKRSSVASVDGMDPMFANVLRRTPSTSSIPPNTSPLHQSLLRRSTRGGTVGRRSRGGGAFPEGRPPSLVGQPEDLAFALSGVSPHGDSIGELVQVETAEFGCQTEFEEEQTLEAIPVSVKESAHMGIQSEPEARPAIISTSDMSTQTDVEEPASKPALRDAGMGTDPEPSPLMVQAESQTPRVFTKEIDVQASLMPAADSLVRRTTITQRDSPASGSRSRLASNATVTASKTSPRTFIGSSYAEESDADTETGTETDMEDYQDARQSIMLGSTPSQSRDDFHSIQMSSMHSESRDDFHSVMTMTDNEYEDNDDDDTDAESIKASRLASTLPSPTPAFVSPSVSYDSKSIEAILIEEPPAPLPKPELKEMSIQTDEWKPPLPTPAVPVAPLLYRVGSTSQQFQFIPPTSPQLASNSNGPSAIPPAVPTPTSHIFRDASIRHQRTSTDSRRQSIESALSSIFDDGPTPKGQAATLAVVDKSRPPMMALPPPPRAPPPPGSMPPPSFIPERRIPTTSTGTYDVPPPRPSSPPPPELIQRATTPTFGSVLSISRTTYGPRSHGSSMPPMQQGLRPLPSTSSFRSAANAAALYVPHGRTGREMSTTSLVTDRSPRSSMSSDQNPFRNPTTPQNRATDLPGRGEGHPTDPAIIHSITQTMIGEFLYKYTRKTIGKGYGERRHRRFFWVHPYTKTLYWSSADPGSSNVSESSAKSAYIEGVRSVLDPNPMPPGLYQYSVVVSTPQREMKITAPTKERHDIWLNALKYLLSRPNAVNVNSPGNATTVPDSPMSLGDFADDDRRPIMSSPQSQRSGRSTRRAVDMFNTTPRGKRSRSQLSVGGSIGKRSGTPAAEYLRWSGPESPYSPTKSFVDVHGDDEDLDFELHGESDDENGFEGLENVRACCDGRHTVGHSGRHHNHHHHHNGSGLDPNAAGPSEQARPVSPSAWSFRSSTNSHESGSAALFSWGRSDGKLRFGSRRSAKTSVT